MSGEPVVWSRLDSGDKFSHCIQHGYFPPVENFSLEQRKTSIRCSFAQNIARITVEDGHFLLIAGTFQDPRVVHYGGLRSERQLREHVEEIFGNYFVIERAEPALINAVAGRKGMSGVAFWMVRKSKSPTSE